MAKFIIDVGMHSGKDTAFYLQKGFRVLAIEANPALCEQAKMQFADALADGRLKILNVAVANRRGTIDLFVNDKKDDWTTISIEMRDRNAARGAESRVVQVEARCFEDVLSQDDPPYYVKIDIEGADIYCLDGLARTDVRPRYISMETHLGDFGIVAGELGMLYRLGYRGFKICNQGNNQVVRCPNPPREGTYVDQRFDGHMSGPFGEEAPGQWMGFDQTLDVYRKLMRIRAKHGSEGTLYHTKWSDLYRRYRQRIGDPVSWYDLHGKLGS